MAHKIVNVKDIQSRKNKDVVSPTSLPHTFTVKSGESGNTYNVTFLPDGTGAMCDCKWGQFRKWATPQSGCHHVLSAFEYALKTNVAAWTDDTQAKKQHRKSIAIGDGVILTLRKAPTQAQTEDALLASLGF